MIAIVLIPAFLYASYTDLKRREIPLWCFPACVLLFCLSEIILGTEKILFHIYGMLCMLIPTLIVSIFGSLGGGDIIMFSCIGFILGPYDLAFYVYSLIFTCVAAFLYFHGEKEIPLAPSAGAAYLIYSLWRLLC